MFVIRSAQMQAIAEARERLFEERLLRHLLSALEQRGQSTPEHELRAHIPLILARGRRFFQTERDLARYAEIVILHLGGWSEADHPESALRLLRARGLSPQHRLDNLEVWATYHQKGEADGRRRIRK